MRTINWDTEVLIVGAGPTGLTAAIELARLGIQFRIVEKRPRRSIHSKALGIQSGSFEQTMEFKFYGSAGFERL